jgi:glycosyltransferase involved in cell wall biosynthesis
MLQSVGASTRTQGVPFVFSVGSSGRTPDAQTAPSRCVRVALTIITNIPAPYREGVYLALQDQLDARVYLLASDEPGREWSARKVPYRHTMVPALAVPGRKLSGGDSARPWYVPVPTWLRRPGFILVAGFGLPAVLTAAVRPRSALIWSPEATLATDAHWSGARVRLRRWLVRRSRACVAGGEASKSYLEYLGADDVLMLPNVAEMPETDECGGDIDPSGHLVLAHVGDWSERKGADLTAEVFQELKRRLDRSGTRVELVIAGQLLGVAVPEGATHLGYLPRDQLWRQLRLHRAKFLLLLSRSERWGFVVAEAMASGVVPIVSRNVGCAPDLLRSTSPDLIVDSPSEAVSTIEKMHSDPSCFLKIATTLNVLERTRTSSWAANVFSSSLQELQ